jgi:hypothetical protein
MNEAEWLACTDHEAMLAAMRGRVPERKMRLLGCASCELNNPGWHGIAVAAKFADGLETLDELRAVWGVTDNMPWSWPERGYEWVSTLLPAPPNFDRREHDPTGFDALVAWRGRFLHALRDIFGNPFRPVTLDPVWVQWNAGTVRKMAQAIYDERAFDRLPILADALEEAGCDNRDVLDHCRSTGEHVRGCWVVDLLLGKE